MDAYGERLEEDMPSGAESAHPESDEDENEKPNDAPHNVSSISTSAGHFDFTFWENKEEAICYCY